MKRLILILLFEERHVPNVIMRYNTSRDPTPRSLNGDAHFQISLLYSIAMALNPITTYHRYLDPIVISLLITQHSHRFINKLIKQLKFPYKTRITLNAKHFHPSNCEHN